MLFFRESRRNSCAFVCIQLLLQDVFLSPANKAEVKKKKNCGRKRTTIYLYQPSYLLANNYSFLGKGPPIYQGPFASEWERQWLLRINILECKMLTHRYRNIKSNYVSPFCMVTSKVIVVVPAEQKQHQCWLWLLQQWQGLDTAFSVSLQFRWKY